MTIPTLNNTFATCTNEQLSEYLIIADLAAGHEIVELLYARYCHTGSSESLYDLWDSFAAAKKVDPELAFQIAKFSFRAAKEKAPKLAKEIVATTDAMIYEVRRSNKDTLAYTMQCTVENWRETLKTPVAKVNVECVIARVVVGQTVAQATRVAQAALAPQPELVKKKIPFWQRLSARLGIGKILGCIGGWFDRAPGQATVGQLDLANS